MLSTTLSIALVLAQGAERPKLAVLELDAGAGVEASLTGPFSEALTAELEARGVFDVI